MWQLVWSVALVVVTTLRQSSRRFIGFQFASQDGGVGVEVSALCSTVLLDLCVLAVGSAVV